VVRRLGRADGPRYIITSDTQGVALGWLGVAPLVLKNAAPLGLKIWKFDPARMRHTEGQRPGTKVAKGNALVPNGPQRCESTMPNGPQRTESTMPKHPPLPECGMGRSFGWPLRIIRPNGAPHASPGQRPGFGQ